MKIHVAKKFGHTALLDVLNVTLLDVTETRDSLNVTANKNFCFKGGENPASRVLLFRGAVSFQRCMNNETKQRK